MQKIPSLFARNYDTDKLVRDEIVPGAEWVVAGEGVATRKLDGTCCMVRDGQLFARYDAKAFTVDKSTGKKHEWDRKPPFGFVPAQDPDPLTGHWPGWVPVGEDPQFKWHRQAWDRDNPMQDGTYELIGPKIQANPENVCIHVLEPHGAEEFRDAPRTFAELMEWLADRDIEGIVWHHPDGRMVKIKKSDFGLKRKP